MHLPLIRPYQCAGKGKETLKKRPKQDRCPLPLNRKAMSGEQDRASARPLKAWSDDFGND
jgi:hypothetical protein